MPKLNRFFYLQPDVVRISKQLLGKYLFTLLRQDFRLLRQPTDNGGQDGERARLRPEITGGIIVETEAYAGTKDRASHAFGNRRTKRTEIMYHKGGVAYVYLCYGMHPLFNIITNKRNIPDAVLIRAIQPTHGIAVMLKRRGKKMLDRSVAGGPGTLTKALGINVSHNGVPLSGNQIWIENRGTKIKKGNIEALPRVGIAYAGPDAKRLWRFRIRGKKWLSKE